MSNQPARVCAAIGCPTLVYGATYCAAHAPRRASTQRRPSAAQQGYGAAWRAKRAAYLRDHPICEDPDGLDCQARATHVDHVTPRRRGGLDEPSNYQALCAPCHSRKTAREDGGFGNARR
jgi:5-methylcytosine-specific restriction protein A